MSERQFDPTETTIDARGETYRLAVLRGTELAPVLPLFSDAFGRALTRDWLQRKYACEQDGLEGFACVAFTEEGEAAGSVGVLPWTVRFDEHTEIAGQMVDVATGSAHRGRGLFVRLAEVAADLCARAGVSFLYGFPNDAAYPIWINKLGYRHVDDMVQYRMPIRTLWAERVARRVPLAAPLYERYVRRILSARSPADLVLANSLAREGFAGVARDRAFHSYKSVFGGSRVVALDGGRVWLNVRHGLLVGDLEASSAADMAMTVRALRSLALRLGVHQILFQASKNTRFTSLSDHFETIAGQPVIYRDLGSRIPVEKVRFTFGDFDNF